MSERIEIQVPDIGDFEDVEVVELLVAKGDAVGVDDPVVSVESDKATMEIPAEVAGTVVEVRVAEGDRVSEGSVLVVVESAAGAPSPEPVESTPDEHSSPPPAPEAVDADPLESTADAQAAQVPPPPASEPTRAVLESSDPQAGAARRLSAEASQPFPDRAGLPHASPLVRRYARELGVPVDVATGTGPQGRILVDDLKRTVRERFATDPGAREGGSGIPAVPAVDFAAFGPIREEPLTRIQKVAGPGLHRSWLNVPHVTQHDAADVTELERFRKETGARRDVKLSPLLLVMKAAVSVLREFPAFRSSLAPEGDRLIVKDYFHLGIAVDTEQGLVVPVVRDVDRKGLVELAAEVSDTAERARARKLSPADLSGACFTISSLGGIGGGHFSPIVNAPEVAILGLGKTRIEPRWEGPSPVEPAPLPGEPQVEPAEAGAFVPRAILPFSLSYDHRVIDGADAVRFTTRLATILSDPVQLLL